jgi:hypothetical protein
MSTTYNSNAVVVNVGVFMKFFFEFGVALAGSRQ